MVPIYAGIIRAIVSFEGAVPETADLRSVKQCI